MIINDYLHEALVEIGIMWSVFISLPGIVYCIHKAFKKPLKRIIVWAVLELDGCIKTAKKNREKRRDVQSRYYLENINGTSGYRIKTR